MTISGSLQVPAIRGRMGDNVYYAAMFPLELAARLFTRTRPDLPPEQRAQRKLVEKRVPEIAKYLLDHEHDWVFSSLTVSYDGDEEFRPAVEDGDIGTLELSLNTRFLINDGQHRHAGIQAALTKNADLGQQTISVVLLPEVDTARSQQIFSDLNRTVQKTSRSLDILYDHRDPMNQVVLAMIPRVPLFAGRVEKDAVSLPLRSAKLVTLSALYDATRQLFDAPIASDDAALEAGETYAKEFWLAVTDAIPLWREIRDGTRRPAEVRAESIATHAVTFHALGALGRRLRAGHHGPSDWSSLLGRLIDVDWSKSNTEWQGICMIGPEIITRRQTRAALADQLSWKIGITTAKPERVLDPS
ncbi:DNA sulfur modification protein DndB [Micromonospora sp. NPDC050417]|uniref:DNA sulfur modification protein DndB n=1 Tax=Micromonospora sp. NPDC050417 TaxID=3364280 RepID=UPI003788665C